MVTFILICLVLITAMILAFGGVVALGACLGGVALIALDVLIGIAPFVLAFLLIRWLLKARG